MNTARTELLALIGWPVEHSRSPAIHGAALEALGVDAAYLAFAVRAERLGEAIAGLRAVGARGLNVTIPHKRAVIAHLDALDADATRIGAVNTIVRDGERLVGTNTDATGLVRSLKDAGCDPAGASALVLGAGGAARAAVVGLTRAGVSRVTVASRRLRCAQELATELAGAIPIGAVDLASVRAEGIDLLVQATSATMSDGAEAFARALPIDRLPERTTVVDLVYTPLETTVLRDARERGLRVVDGLGMLVHQAALSLERWLGVSPPIEVMRAAALER